MSVYKHRRETSMVNETVLSGTKESKNKDLRLTVTELDKVRRNSIVFVALGIVSLLTFVAIFSLGAGEMESYIIITLVIQLSTFLLFSILHFTRKWIGYIGYIAIVGTAISITATSVFSPTMTNVLGIFYFLILTMIYMHYWTVIVSGIYGLFVLIVVINSQKDSAYFNSEEGITYYIYYILICILLFSLLKVSNHVSREME